MHESSCTATAHAAAAEPVLAVVDRTFLISVPILMLAVWIGLPAQFDIWRLIGGAVQALTVALGLLGRAGRAPWRGVGYVVIALCASTLTLWTIGPFTGVGAFLGLAVLFAGAFLTVRGVVVVVVLALVAIGARALLGGTLGPEPAVEGRIEITVALWLGTGLATLVLAWTAIRVLGALITSLAGSYARAAEAYRVETESRAQLASSRQQLEELAQVEMVGRLAGGVAHDVNNALAAILAASDVLTTEVTTPAQRRHLAELEAASYHAADLVRDLLWIGRKFPASTTATADLDATARACLERLARVARKLAIDVRIGPRLQVAMSPEHLEQVLFGLAVGIHRCGVTALTLTAALVDELVEIELGGAIAIAPSAAPRHAMQVQLGVSAARELVRQSGGALAMAESPDHVAVTLQLPLAAGGRRLASTPRPHLATALVIEDEPMVLRRLCQLVTRRGYEVTGASTVAEGLARLEGDPDLVVTDLQLPDGSGEQIALAAFARDATRPIVVCSGFGADAALHDRLRAARIRYLAKPFTAEDLEAAIPSAQEAA